MKPLSTQVKYQQWDIQYRKMAQDIEPDLFDDIEGMIYSFCMLEVYHDLGSIIEDVLLERFNYVS